MANHPLMNVTPTQPPSDSARPRRRADERGPERAELQPFGGLRPKLLYERYGMLENPFGVTPNPRYLYQSRTHAEARSSLIIGIECGVGFQALIAPPGMGKTTILFDVLERFNKVARTALLFQIQGDSRDFLRYLLSELGSDAPDSSVVHLQEAINQLLVREFRSGRRTIIVIDEAQSLDTSVLETIRLLSNFETRSEKLLQIILTGQPQLAQRLTNPELAQLQQRISILTTLVPFNLEDTSKYIEHRLKIAGYQGPPLYSSAALTLIWKSSGGVPREINKLCFNAMLLASAAEQEQVDSDIVHEVVADLDLDRIRSSTEDADEVDPVQSGTTAAKIASTSAEKNADQVAVPETDVGTLPGARLGGLPSCETKPMMTQNFGEQQLGAISVPNPSDRFDQELVGWFVLHGGVWCGTAAELLAALNTRVDVGNNLWPQSRRALYAHIESHRLMLRSLGVDVSLQHGYPRMISVRSCQDEKPARKPPSGSSGIDSTSDPAMNLPRLASDQKTSAADSDEVSPAANETFSQDTPMAESDLAERFVDGKYADGLLHPFRTTSDEETSLKTSPNPESMVLGSLASKLPAAPTLLWLSLKRAWMRNMRAM